MMTPLKKWRTELSLKLGTTVTQEKAAEMLGYSATYYRKMEYSVHPVSLTVARMMKKVMKDAK